MAETTVERAYQNYCTTIKARGKPAVSFEKFKLSWKKGPQRRKGQEAFLAVALKQIAEDVRD